MGSYCGIDCFMTHSEPPFQLHPGCFSLKGDVDRVEHIHPRSHLTGVHFFSLFFLLKVKSPSESWQLLVGISISAAVEADYMGLCHILAAI